MSRTLAFTAQKGGINRLRVRGGARADNLYDLVNGWVTNEQTVENREGTVREAVLAATTRGLTAFQDVLHIFSYQLEEDVPDGYLANVLSHPTDDTATLVEIHFAQPFMGALYVVAEWSDGGIFHYWLASSGPWTADTVHLEGDVVTPTEPNGLLYKATPNNPAAPTQTWQPLTNYAVGDKVLPTVYNGYYFEVTATSGDVPISGAFEPTWNATEGAETVESADGTNAPASSGAAETAPQVPPDVRDRYGTGNTAISDASAAAIGLSDTVPKWTPGTLYQPGALVKPLSVAPVVSSAIPNAGFESGDTAWTKGTGWHITNASTPGSKGFYPYQGAYYAYWDENEGQDLGYQYLTMATAVPVVPGQFVSASCYESRKGGSNSAYDAAIVMLWYDESDVLVKETVGSTSSTDQAKDYRVFTVQDSTPGGATQLKLAFKAQGTNSGGRGAIDSWTWDYVNLTPAATDFTIYQAVQANAGVSGTSEPTWPGAGNTVVDNEVTWLGGVTSVITWTARPIMKTGATEPSVWGDEPGSATTDNTISWIATTGFVEQAPQSEIVVIAAKKIFAGDRDIAPYSATVNPLDWTTADDAGYLPTGLNTYGANDIAAMGLYRGNLVPFNSAGMQMWQVDEDPELMQFIDGLPVGSTYHQALQSVANDLVFLTQLGYRNVSIAKGATNIQAGDFGQPIDPLVRPKIVAGTYEPKSIFYPARGQYWGWFGPEVFVCTLNDKGRAWGRYVFPEAITNATLLGNDLYLRTATHKVWKVDDQTLVDDYAAAVPPDPANLLMHFDELEDFKVTHGAPIDSALVPNTITSNNEESLTTCQSQAAVAKFAPSALAVTSKLGTDFFFAIDTPNFDLGAETQWSIEAWVYRPGVTDSIQAVFGESGLRTYLDFTSGLSHFIWRPTFSGTQRTLTGAAALAVGQWHHLCVCRDGVNLRLFQNGVLSDSVSDVTTVYWGTALRIAKIQTDSVRSFYMDELRVVVGQALFTADFTPPVRAYDPVGSPESFTIFEGTVWWPSLDLGNLGTDKQLDAFDLVCNGEVAVQFGYDQRDPTVLTDEYVLDGDTLPATPIPFPLSAPSFAPKLTFSGEQRWKWEAMNLYVQDNL